MGAGLAVELAQQVGGAVRHQGVLAEIRGGVDHAQQLGHPFHLIQIADDGLHVGSTVEAGLPGPVVPLLHRETGSQLAPIRRSRRVPAYEQDVANFDRPGAAGRAGPVAGSSRPMAFSLFSTSILFLLFCRNDSGWYAPPLSPPTPPAVHGRPVSRPSQSPR